MQSTASMKKARPRRTIWIILAVIAVIVLLGVLVGPRIAERMSERTAGLNAQSGDVVAAFVGDLSSSATASGQVEAIQKAHLAANTPGVVEAVHVQVGDQVQAGDQLVQLDTRDLELRRQRASQNLALSEVNLEALLSGPEVADIVAAEAAVLSAQVKLDSLQAGPDELDIAESDANIRAQQANLGSASSSYNKAVESISDSAISTSELDLINAQIAYEEAKRTNESFPIASTHEALEDAAENLAISQVAFDELRAGPNQGSLNSAASGVAAAAANLDQSIANHDALLAGSTANQIAAAEATLAQAKANLATLTAAASDSDIVIAEAQLEQSKLALIDAEEILAKAALTAPFNGTITNVYVTEGEYANGDVIEIVSNDLKVVLSVDEIDIGKLAPSQPTIITLETWPDVEIAGEVGYIAPDASSSGSNGVVTYDVQINLEETELPILVGMTANARIIDSNLEDVLLVPNAAITANREAGTYQVDLVTGESDGLPVTEQVEVIIGLRDRDFTQIQSGLSDGDQVLIGELTAPTASFGPGGGGGPFGGN